MKLLNLQKNESDNSFEIRIKYDDSYIKYEKNKLYVSSACICNEGYLPWDSSTKTDANVCMLSGSPAGLGTFGFSDIKYEMLGTGKYSGQLLYRGTYPSGKYIDNYKYFMFDAQTLTDWHAIYIDLKTGNMFTKCYAKPDSIGNAGLRQ